MPGKPPNPPATNCNPGFVKWNGTETGRGEDKNVPGAAITAAIADAEKKANKELGKFEAQGCPAGCGWQSNVRDDDVITITNPVKKVPVKGKGMAFVCDLTLDWSETIYCYPNQNAKKAADDKRADEKREREKKAKEEGK
jgi:hypothetical protein